MLKGFPTLRDFLILCYMNTDNNTYSDRMMWLIAKDITLSNKQVPPRILLINGRVTTSLKKICNYANEFYINNVNNLRKKIQLTLYIYLNFLFLE